MILVAEPADEVLWFSFKEMRSVFSEELISSLRCSSVSEVALLRAVFTLICSWHHLLHLGKLHILSLSGAQGKSLSVPLVVSVLLKIPSGRCQRPASRQKKGYRPGNDFVCSIEDSSSPSLGLYQWLGAFLLTSGVNCVLSTADVVFSRLG